MNNTFHRVAAKGFTLIELLIVVIIIAILAAIAIPQFSNTSSDAQEASLDANLATMRSAIELYRVQHRNKYPGLLASAAGTDCSTSGKGVGTAKDVSSFKEALTKFSDIDGKTCDVNPAGGGYVYGPYLRAIPDEPITPKKDIVLVEDVANAVPTAATGGWRFNMTTGQFVMNSNAKARDQRLYYEH